MNINDIKTLKDMLLHSKEEYSNVNFIEYKTDDGSIMSKTYSDLFEYSNRFANMLFKKGFSSSKIAIIGRASFEWACAFFGTLCSNNIYVPLAINESNDMLIKLINFADCEVLVFSGVRDDLCTLIKNQNPNVKLFVSLDNTSKSEEIINISDIFKKYSSNVDIPVSSSSLAAICFTSGTTGFPKGAMITHGNFVYSSTSVHAFLPTKRMLAILPVNHSFCLTGTILKSVLLGRTVCVSSIATIIEDFKLFKPDDIMAVPAIIKKFMMLAIKHAKSNPELDFKRAVNDYLGGNMVEIVSGGAPLDPELNELYDSTGIRVMNGYGMTECSPIIANNSWENYKYGSCGKPIPCMETKFIDGELLVRGPSVMQGYYKNEEATKEIFEEDGFMHTGDLGYIDDEGFLFINGRSKNLILTDNGENVSAEMIEAKFSNEDFVVECICYNEGSAICAEIYPNRQYVEANKITDLNSAALKIIEKVNATLLPFQRISAFVLRDIPFAHTSSNKIKRNSKLGLKGAKREIVEPKNSAEINVFDAVKMVLGISQLSMTDNFFALGGNSINATELAVALNTTAQTIYDNPFLKDLALATAKSKNYFIDKISNINESILESAHKITDKKQENILLTGATGFLGVHILSELIQRQVNVTCLVRSEKRFIDNFKYYFPNDDISNVKIVIGSITKPLFGLNKDEYNKLCNNTDSVFHVAANVHHAGNYSDLERTNIEGTKNIIEFCKKATAILHHTSTVSLHGAGTVKQTYSNAAFDEDTLDICQRYADNVYIHSKYCAEQEVITARQEGLEANIYRIGNLTWRKSDGLFQKNTEDNGFLHRIRAILKLSLLSDSMDKYPTDLTAVDECAKAYVSLALSEKVNEIYHLLNPNYLEIKKLFEFLSIKYKTVSNLELLETVNQSSINDRDIKVYLFYLMISAKSKEVDVKSDFTVERLDSMEFQWSCIDENYIKKYFEFKNTKIFENFTPVFDCSSSAFLNPVQQMTIGNMKDAEIENAEVFSGEDSLLKLSGAIADNGLKKPYIITFPQALENDKVKEFLHSFAQYAISTDVLPDPPISNVFSQAERYLNNNCDCIVAVGGGSVIDTAKLAGLLASNKGQKLDDIAKVDSIFNKSVPLYAAPTTSGTGSEVTLFAVATDEDENKKKPYVSDKFLPSCIALCPSLTLSVPKMATAYTAIDALCHAVEAYSSTFANYFKDDKQYALSASKRIFAFLPFCMQNLNDINAREQLQLAAFEAGLSFRRISTSYIHAVAHRIGEIYHLPHGHAIALYFAKILRNSLPNNAQALAEMNEYCGFKNVGNDADNANNFIKEIEKLIQSCGIDMSFEVKEKDVEEICMRAQDEAKLTGYPKIFSDEKLKAIIRGENV